MKNKVVIIILLFIVLAGAVYNRALPAKPQKDLLPEIKATPFPKPDTYSSQPEQQEITIPSTTPLPLPSPDQTMPIPNPSTPAITRNFPIVQYTNQSLGYYFEYPSGWTAKNINNDLYVQSPEYKIEYSSQTLASGYEISIIRKPTDQTNIDSLFKSLPLANSIAKNKIYTQVDQLKAIQYDYSLQNVNATSTIFIQQGFYFEIKFRYADQQQKQTGWPYYLHSQNSFKFI